MQTTTSAVHFVLEDRCEYLILACRTGRGQGTSLLHKRQRDFRLPRSSIQLQYRVAAYALSTALQHTCAVPRSRLHVLLQYHSAAYSFSTTHQHTGSVMHSSTQQ
eukprot:3854899-Rhodomonas_salina.1